MPDSGPPARLVLEDGTVFAGVAFGACPPHRGPLTIPGEVVFNTALTGYQEALTDPSYAGQILTFTAPLIGNYGVSGDDVESTRPQVVGCVVRELARRYSNHRAVSSLDAWLADAGVLGIERIDTRALVRRLRTQGAMRGVLSSDPALTDDELVDLARQSPVMSGRNLAAEVSPDDTSRWTEDLGRWAVGRSGRAEGKHSSSTGGPVEGRPLRVLALDCGAKHNILRHLAERGCEVTVAPHDMSAADIRASKPDGLFISNGPGDPAAVQSTIAVLREVAGEIPTFGICLGHQLLALALGAKAFKLKFGHRGTNQPVRNLLTGRVEITSQNHGFCIDAASLEGIDCEPTHINLNDGTLAGFRHRSRPIFAVQHHPESSPGPHDASYLFDCFVLMMQTGRPLDAEAMQQAQEKAVEASWAGS